MHAFSETFVFWVVVATQIAGIGSVLVARLCEKTWGAAASQRTFFVCLVAVGLATMLAVSLQAAIWIGGAGTLGIMAVGATLDLGAGSRPAPEF